MKKRNKTLTTERFLALSDAEKEAIYRECEAIGPGDGKPLTAAQEARWRRAMRKMKRPERAKPKPAKRVQISMEQALLKAADRFAAEHGLSRSQVVAQGVRKLLAG